MLSRLPQLSRRDLLAALGRPVDAASLAAFRILFGLMMCFGSLRFLLNGWVERFFVKPDYFFTFWGFDFVGPLPGFWMHAAFVALAVLALNIALGLLYRPSIIAFFLLFTYVELIDVANYLNHYYLVSLLAFLMCFLPMNAAWSLDARLRPALGRAEVGAWALYALRFQVALVYFYAGLAKFQPDWLIHAQPLNIWLNARVDTPVIGAWLDIWEVALLMSWAGFVYDTSIAFFLLWRRTRPLAFAAVVVFHGLTHVFFTIGMFPLIMIVNATLFFEPDWARRVGRGFGLRTSPPRTAREPDAARTVRVPRLAVAGLAIWLLIQIAMPLRHLAYPGPVIWHEQGMRWSWKVMVREKDGSVSFWVRDPSTDRRFYVDPGKYLTDHQEREMGGQPDLILRLAHDIGTQWRDKLGREVEVYADAVVSLNGRPPAPLIDPTVDLMQVDDGISRAAWILPAPTAAPPRLGRSLF